VSSPVSSSPVSSAPVNIIESATVAPQGR
jgi:hypothetical protein